MAPSSDHQLSPVPSENRDPNVLSRPQHSHPRTPPPPCASHHSKHLRLPGHACAPRPQESSDSRSSSPPCRLHSRVSRTAGAVAASLQRKRRCRVLAEEKHAANVVEMRTGRRRQSGNPDDKLKQEPEGSSVLQVDVSPPSAAACRKALGMDGKIVDIYLIGASVTKKKDSDGCANSGVNDDGSSDKAGGSSDEGGDEIISPEKGGSWRLKAVLAEYGGLTPTRKERVKRLVSAFEKLVSTKNGGVEKPAASNNHQLHQFTYLHSSSASNHRLGFIKCQVSSAAPKASGSNSQTTIASIATTTTTTGDRRSNTPGSKSAMHRPFSPSLNRNNLVDQQQQTKQIQAAGRKLFNESCRTPSSCRTPALGSQRPHSDNQVDLQLKTPRTASSCRPQPFKLLTEERGKLKKEEFVAKLKQIMAEEERHRIPLAQGLPWTTDEPDIPRKPQMKENTVPLDIHLNSDLRATERAEFDRYVSEKLLRLEEKRLEEELLRKIELEQVIKKMRQEMVPKAQPMPYFDRPFRPKRSSKQLTVPKEPHFHLHSKQPKRQKCLASDTLLR